MKIYLTESQFKKYVHYLKEETVGNLIKKLQKYPEDMNVDCNDGNGGYSSIKDIKKQNWDEKDGKHETVTIMHGHYDKKESLTEDIETLCQRLIMEDTATPDQVLISGEDNYIVDWKIDNARCEARPFGYDSSYQLHVGEIGEYHHALEKRQRCSLENECGRLWMNGQYITAWGGDTYENKRMFRLLINDIKKFGIDLSNTIFLYEDFYGTVMAVPLMKYIGGDRGVPYTKMIKNTDVESKDRVYPWSKMPGESDAEKRENWYIWNGRMVDENKANKTNKGGK